jgi:hypothetical protein
VAESPASRSHDKGLALLTSLTPLTEEAFSVFLCGVPWLVVRLAGSYLPLTLLTWSSWYIWCRRYFTAPWLLPGITSATSLGDIGSGLLLSSNRIAPRSSDMWTSSAVPSMVQQAVLWFQCRAYSAGSSMSRPSTYRVGPRAPALRRRII